MKLKVTYNLSVNRMEYVMLQVALGELLKAVQQGRTAYTADEVQAVLDGIGRDDPG